MTGPFQISEAARLVGVSPSTIRAWERQGLLGSIGRKGRFRRYDQQDIERLRTIRRLRMQGLNTPAIRLMLNQQLLPGLAPDSPSEIPLGRRLRQLRLKKRLTQAEVAGASGLSISHISAIERGEQGPSIWALHRLVSALGAQVADLFARSDSRPPRRLILHQHRRYISMAGGRIRVAQLAEGAKLLEPHFYIAEPGAGSEGEYAHEGEEFVFVLEGRVEFSLEEEERYDLGPGDALTFSSQLRHRWTSLGDQPAVILWINTPVTF